ncbi:MAG: hypothetical protein ACE366_09655 [Bradymonadia bacterium]
MSAKGPRQSSPLFVDPEDLEADLSTIQDLLDTYSRQFRGTLQRIHFKRGFGVVKGHNGKTYEFSVQTVSVGGALQRLRDIKPGMAVTFDLAHTERGPRISRLWVGALKSPAEALSMESTASLDDEVESD